MKSLKIISLFFDALHTNNILYVHWKSNMNLHKALEGYDDLDILVSSGDEDKLYKIFKEFNIIRGFSENDSWQEKVVHYYALDEETASIVHIHLHFQLPVGYDYNKNFVLPVVEKVLANRVLLHGVYVSSPEHEYILLVLRILIKNALTPFLLSSPKTQINLIKGSKIVTGNTYKEFLHLKNIISETALSKSLEQDFDFINESLFRSCESVIIRNTSLKEYVKSARQLKKKLKPYASQTEISSFFLSFTRINRNRLLKIKRIIFGNALKGTKVPEYGGRIFAFVGGDGAGKSTNIQILKNKLSHNFKTTSIHIGKPPKSVRGFILYYTSKVFSTLGIKNYGKLLMYLRLAIDREKAFRRANSLREKGILVILDRIPLPSISAMDAPRINATDFPKLAEYERKKYNSIGGVDLLFVMKLNPEIALKRRPKDDPDILRIRSGQIWEGVWEHPYQLVTDTGRLDFFQVENNILKNAWKNITAPYKRVEVLGISGTGKSTVTDECKNQYSNVIKNIALKKYPNFLLKAAFFHPLGARKFISSRKITPDRFKFILHYYKIVIDRYKKKSIGLNSHLILDQGIIFYYISALNEGFIQKDQFLDEVNKISGFFDYLVLLKAPKEVLFVRIKNRKDLGIGRAKEMTLKEFSVFYEKYFEAFEVLKQTNLKVVEIDSSSMKSEAMTHLIMNLE